MAGKASAKAGDDKRDHKSVRGQSARGRAQPRKTSPLRAAAAVRRQPGRPQKFSEEERRAQLIDVAEEAFLHTGYGATSMDDIASRAGMSKKTLYQLFDTKEALFGAVVEARLLSFTTNMDTGLDRPAEEILTAFLMQVAQFVLLPRRIAMLRLAIAESPRSPELANAFYRCGPKRGCSKLTKLITDLGERGVLAVADPHAAASMLFFMAMGEFHMLNLIGATQNLTAELIEGRVRAAVSLFLDGARPRA